MAETEYRIEHDTMGEVKVPVTALYRAQTQRAVENFPISGLHLSPHHIAALGQIKRAAALTNLELGVIDHATVRLPLVEGTPEHLDRLRQGLVASGLAGTRS